MFRQMLRRSVFVLFIDFALPICLLA